MVSIITFYGLLSVKNLICLLHFISKLCELSSQYAGLVLSGQLFLLGIITPLENLVNCFFIFSSHFLVIIL